MTDEEKIDRLEELIESYQASPSNELLNQVVHQIRQCNLLVPVVRGEGEEIAPRCIVGKEQEVYLPVYTSKKHLTREAPDQMIACIPYDSVNRMALVPEAEIAGIIINPFTSDLGFRPDLLKRIAEVAAREEQERTEGKVLKLTEPQYHVFARRQMEFGTLPVRFFAEGKVFVDRLCEERETLIDRMYEEVYQERRLYPYCVEDFSVMVMNISEDLTVLRIDMPEQNMEVPSCYRIYLTWSLERQQGRYFTVEKTKGEEQLLGELDSQLKHVTHSDRSIEGTELQNILAMEQAGGEQ